jgi:RimJ/RimL family protein N-acetyltransferase
VEIRLAALTADDAAAQCAGEDGATVRWLTGGYGTVEGTQDYFRMLADNAQAGRGKRGFGVWLDGRLAGYVDCDPDLTDGLEDGDVNISFGVHPWARGRGVAGEAVRRMCDYLREQRLGTRAALRIEPESRAPPGHRPQAESVSRPIEVTPPGFMGLLGAVGKKLPFVAVTAGWPGCETVTSLG